MRVWAFPNNYPYDRPGMTSAGIFAHRQYKGLQAAGAEVNVVLPTPWHPGKLLSRLNKDWQQWSQLDYPIKRVYDGVQVYHPRIANMKPGRIFRKPYRQRYTESLLRFFRSMNVDPRRDIVYCQWLPEAYFVKDAAKQLGLKLTTLAIGDDVLVYPHGSKANFEAVRSTLAASDGRFAVAKYLGDEANKLFGTNYKFEAIRRGVNYDVFKPASAAEAREARTLFGIKEHDKVILTIGSAIVRKGWLDLFDAARILADTGAEFVLAAAYSGVGEVNLAAEIEQRGLQDHFLDLGEVTPQQISKLYNAADIFCLPSHWEGIANSVVEAMASGMPVVTTNVCGHPEVIQSSDTGVLINPKEPKVLADKLQLLLTDEQLRTRLGKNARTFITGVWGNFNDNAAKLYDRLQDVLKQ